MILIAPRTALSPVRFDDKCSLQFPKKQVLLALHQQFIVHHKTPPTKTKGNGIMHRAERPLTKKSHVALDEDWQEIFKLTVMEADRLLAERLQTREREELTDEEKGKLFMELMEKRRKHCAALRAQEKRNRPPTKAQKRSQMSTYLKHMEVQERNEKKVQSSKEKLKAAKRRVLKLDEHEDVEADNTAELKKHLVIKKDDDIAIDVIPLATKL
ncbi:hypothetical protein Tco_0984459 [Tanacetum coccineum]